jgi:hypothetical protein
MAVLAVLLALAANHITKGLYYLTVAQERVSDLGLRRMEVFYFQDHVSPQSQANYFQSHKNPELTQLADGADVTERHGVLDQSGQTPWTYPLQMAVYPPVPVRAGRLYLASLDIAALILIAWAADRYARRNGVSPAGRTATALSVVAVSAIDSTMTTGQNSLVINAGLFVLLLALEHPAALPWDVAAGLGLAVAMLKPSTGALFVIAPLAARRLRPVMICAAIVTAGWVFSAWWVHLSPLYQLRQFNAATLNVITQGANVLLHAVRAVTSDTFARNALGLAGLGAAVAVAWRMRPVSFATFSMLAIIARLFTYHRRYDDVLLQFVVIQLCVLAWTEGASRRWTAGWLAAGLTVWLPYSLYVPTGAQVAQVVCWLACLALLFSTRIGALRSDRAATP